MVRASIPDDLAHVCVVHATQEAYTAGSGSTGRVSARRGDAALREAATPDEQPGRLLGGARPHSTVRQYCFRHSQTANRAPRPQVRVSSYLPTPIVWAFDWSPDMLSLASTESGKAQRPEGCRGHTMRCCWYVLLRCTFQGFWVVLLECICHSPAAAAKGILEIRAPDTSSA